MNGRSKSLRLFAVFALSGVLTVTCLVSIGGNFSSSVRNYLDIVMAVLMLGLLLCVLELCLGVELCDFCCGQGSRQQDAEGRNWDSNPLTPEPSEAPPAYEVIMSHGEEETQTGGASGGGRERAVSIKRDLSLYFKPSAPGNDSRAPHMRPSVSPGVNETSFMSADELWLAVDSLPSYEEAVARVLEEEAPTRRREEETEARLREVRSREEVVVTRQQEAQLRREPAVARVREEDT